MTGVEYALIHVQEPILYVIRKQQRYSPQQTTPIADYYIIAGKVYQAPDLGSVLNSRIVRMTSNKFVLLSFWLILLLGHPSECVHIVLSICGSYVQEKEA